MNDFLPHKIIRSLEDCYSFATGLPNDHSLRRFNHRDIIVSQSIKVVHQTVDLPIIAHEEIIAGYGKVIREFNETLPIQRPFEERHRLQAFMMLACGQGTDDRLAASARSRGEACSPSRPGYVQGRSKRFTRPVPLQ